MRTLKFRAKPQKGGPWLIGDLLHNRGTTYIAPAGRFCFDGETESDFAVLPATAGEYTGLKDFGGREIYEGDVIAGAFRESMPTEKFAVVWDAKSAGFQVRPMSPSLMGYFVPPSLADLAGDIRFRVAGTVFDVDGRA